MRNGNSLCFAAFVRVSTERQEKQGESLLTQRSSIERDVESLDGKIIQWYGGQEHATEGWEKLEINKLLEDAKKPNRKWNAVIVADADRWSRDNAQSKYGLDVFKNNDIRFFIGQSEQDLFDASHLLFLGMSAEVGAFYARSQKKKSYINRIHRAKRGIPTGGKLPYGRLYVDGKWQVDKEKQKLIEDVAQRYLAGESMEILAKELNMNHSSLHKILTKRTGKKWSLKFHSKELNIRETVPFEIPPLLPQVTIEAILSRVEANKTYHHGHIKHKYLLSRMIFCGKCGYSLFGQTNGNGKRYYRHSSRKHKHSCRGQNPWVVADDFENLIIAELFDMFGNPKAVKKAMKTALPDLEKSRKYEKDKIRVNQEIDKIKKARAKILDWVVDESISDSDAQNKLRELKEKEAKLRDDMFRVAEYLNNMPSKEQMESSAKSIRRHLPKSFIRANARKGILNREIDRMSWDDKRVLLQEVFSGKTPDGKRCGVYVFLNEQGFKYEIRGIIINESGDIPLSGSLGGEFSYAGKVGKRESKSTVTNSALR